MADLVVGLAKSAVEGTLTMARSAMDNEGLQKDVQGDLKLISGELEMMNAFLDTTKDDHVTDNVTRTLVRQVRNVALDVEDCIEFVVRLDGKQQSTWWRLKIPTCMLAAPLAANPNAVVADIQLLKARVEAMGLRNLCYSRIADSGLKPTAEQMHQQDAAIATASNILVTAKDVEEKQSSQTVNLITLINKKDPSSDEDSYYLFSNDEDEDNDEEIYDSDEEKEDKDEGKMNSSRKDKNEDDQVLQVISVLATSGGLGVRSIKNAYDDKRTCSSFKHRAWVKLMHPFNPHQFMQNLLAQFYMNSYSVKRQETVDVQKQKKMPTNGPPNPESRTVDVQETTEMPANGEPNQEAKKMPTNEALNYKSTTGDAQDPIMKVLTEGKLNEEFITKQMDEKYLVVLEDVSAMADWEAVRAYLPDKSNGSCIIVHTRQDGIAFSCVGDGYQVSVLDSKFSADNSVHVVYKKVDAEDSSQSSQVSEATNEEFMKEDSLVGRDMDIQHLSSLLSRGPRRMDVISVWGMPGIGKSSLVKHCYDKERIGWRYYKLAANIMYCWVALSHPFNLVEFSRKLLVGLLDSKEREAAFGTRKVTVKDVTDWCCKYLKENRALVVIDGLQSKEAWDKAKSAFGEASNINAIIVIITNDKSVAEYCATHSSFVWNVKGLEVDKAIELFDKKLSGKSIEPEKKKRILNKCGGHPRVIIYAAQYLSYSRSLDKNDDLMSVLATTEDMKDLFRWCVAYFRSCCPGIKSCIFYLSIFPLNHTIRRRRLVRRWIAEGYSRDTKGITAEEDGEMSFLKLVRLSMIQVPGTIALTDPERMPWCQVNGFFLEYINSQLKEDNLVFALQGHCRKNLENTGRHLAIHENWDRDKNVYGSIDFSRLRSLTVFGKWEPFFISDKMKLLRVLDLEDTSADVTNEDVKNMVKVLSGLKFLSLRRCHQITHLPDSLGDLKQLQTLDIRETSVMNLPKSINEIEKLQYIRAGTTPSVEDDRNTVKRVLLAKQLMSCSCATLVRKLSTTRRHPDECSYHGGVKVPKGIGKLSNLQTLGVVNIRAAGGKAILEELKNITQLHKLEVSGINRRNIQIFFSAISGLAHLNSLSLQVQVDDDSNEAGFLDDIPSSPANLRSLKLYGLGRKLPRWIKKLKTLRKLSLKMTMLSQEGVQLLAHQKLSCLRLFLSELQDDGPHFSIHNCGFKVKFLEVSCSSSSRATIAFENCSVEVLRIRCGGTSSLQISGLQNVKNLHEVWLSGSYDETLKQQLECELANFSESENRDSQYKKPVLRLEKQVRRLHVQ